jgi:hypothetical protein
MNIQNDTPATALRRRMSACFGGKVDIARRMAVRLTRDIRCAGSCYWESGKRPQTHDRQPGNSLVGNSASKIWTTRSYGGTAEEELETARPIALMRRSVN